MIITAVILCGGQGTRLRPVIGDLPKGLAPVAGRPFSEYILDNLVEQGVSKIVLCVRKDQLQAIPYVEDISYSKSGVDAKLVYSVEDTPLGTGGALRNALPLLDSDPVLVLNGDTFCKFDLAVMQRAYQDYELMLTHWGYFRPSRSGVLLATKEFMGWLDPKYSLEKNIEWAFNSGEWMSIGPSDPIFHDIGTPDGYAQAEEFLRQQGIIA